MNASSGRWLVPFALTTSLMMFLVGQMIGNCIITSSDSPPPQRRLPTYHQKCLKCGAEWTVQIIDPAQYDQVPPPVIPWCLDDGEFCETGLDILIKAEFSKESEEFIAHCLACESCKCTFSPEDWARILEKRKDHSSD